MKPADLRDLPYEELQTKLAEAKQELFNLRFQLATNQLANTARLKAVKKEIARLRTEMRAREIEAQKANAAAEGEA